MTEPEHPPEGLPAELRELLAVEQARGPVTPEISSASARALGGALTTGGAGLGPASGAAGSRPTPVAISGGQAATSGAASASGYAASSAATLAGVKLVPLALAFLLGGGVGAAVATVLLRAPAAQHATLTAPARPAHTLPLPPPALAEQPALARPTGPQLEPPAPIPVHVSTSDAGIEARHAPASSDRDLTSERNLLEQARSALSAGRSQAALSALEQHARRFPQGRLAEERESLRVPALVLTGRYDEARRRAARFREQHPSSLFAPLVDNALQSIP